MSDNIRTVLITGCSPGSLGGALALVFQKRGLKVHGAARDPDMASELESTGIHCVALDVLDDASIKQCVQHISDSNGGKLDMLVNSVGRGHYQPFLHLDLKKARELFDLNVWGYVSFLRNLTRDSRRSLESGLEHRKRDWHSTQNHVLSSKSLGRVPIVIFSLPRPPVRLLCVS